MDIGNIRLLAVLAVLAVNASAASGHGLSSLELTEAEVHSELNTMREHPAVSIGPGAVRGCWV